MFLTLHSCGDNNPIEEPDVVSEIITELNIASGASTQSISFTTNKNWEATISSSQGDKSWCTISPANGNAGVVNITVAATENTGYEDRSATLTIKTGITVKKITISQKQKKAIIISNKEYSISKDGGTFLVEVSTNVDMKIFIPDNIDWVHYHSTTTRALESKQLNFKVDQNNLFDKREGIITVTNVDNNVSESFKVSQEGNEILSVKTPGTLSSLLTEEQIGSIEELTIVGEINYADFETIKKMNNLKSLILDGVRIMKGDVVVNEFSKGLLNTNSILNNIVLPENIKSIGRSAFSNFTNLTSITIPEGVSSIGAYAFSNCTGLTSLTIPEGIVKIEEGTFYESGLISFNIPSTVTTIEGGSIYQGKSGAFFLCKSLKSITIPNGVKTIGGGAFFGCSALTSIIIPESVNNIGNLAFYGCEGLTSIIIPDGVSTIATGTFNNCSRLSSVTIPESVTSIGYEAFWGCTSLTSISIPKNVISIGIRAFRDCINLPSIIIPNLVTTIGYEAFANCSKLTSIIIPDLVTDLGGEAFRDCTGLTSITISKNVTKIKSNTFYGCVNVEKVSIKSINPPIENGDIPQVNTIKLYIPIGTKDAYQNSEYWKGFYQYIEE